MTDPYDNYAEYYDQGTTTDITAKVDLIKRTIRRLNPSAKEVLEVACGTGNVLELLQTTYGVVGLDLSPNMIRIARQKLPNIEMYVEDMTLFKLQRKFDAIICVFDSVNHLLNFEAWEALFDRAKEHLNHGGVFIMDVNTIEKLENFVMLPPHKIDLKEGYQVAKVIKDENEIYHWRLDIHTLEGSEDKISENDIPEVAFPLQQVEDALSRRFKSIDRFTPSGEVADESAYRIYFACVV